MKLSPPKVATFLIAFALGCAAIANYYGRLGIPILTGNDFFFVSIAYLFLLLGSIFQFL